MGRIGGDRVAFPDIHEFPESDPGRYGREMGRIIAALLELFGGRVPAPRVTPVPPDPPRP
jgi:hypothetical protein